MWAVLTPPDFVRDPGPDAGVCLHCFHWGRKSETEGRCRVAGPDPTTWHTTHGEDSCEEFVGRARL